MHRCVVCRVEKDDSLFPFKSKNYPACKVCLPFYKKAKRRESVEYIEQFKDSKPCKDCGIVYPTYVMDFDHLRDKEINISDMSRNRCSIKKIQKEIDKCDLVCANCHRERTFNGHVPKTELDEVVLDVHYQTPSDD